MAQSDVHAKVAAQFGPTAARYAASQGHGNLSVLAELVELVDPRPTDTVLDIATGAGHVALAFAPRVASVTALDLTPSMLDQVMATAGERGLGNVRTVHAKAEEIPLPDGSFDIVTVRLAPHHFADVEGFLREVARVLKTEGKFLLVDSVVPEDDFLDGEINRLELLRDPSHVRNYRPSEWLAMLRAARFTVVFSKVASHAGGTRMELLGWMDRINTPLENRPALEEAFRHPDARVREALRIVDEAGVVSFELDELTLLAVRNT